MRSILPVLVCGFIFFMSSCPGTLSGAQSSFFTNFFMKFSIFQVAGYEITSTIVRKLAHMAEFALLGATINWSFYKTDRRSAERLSFLLSVGFAMTDEFHQVFVSGRAASWQDVLIDALGILIGIAFSSLISKSSAN